MSEQKTLELVDALQKQINLLQEQINSHQKVLDIDGHSIEELYSNFRIEDRNIESLQAQIDELRGYLRALADDMNNLRNLFP